MRSSTRALLRRLLALTLALGLLPAAGGGALCLAHWFGGAPSEAPVHAGHAAHGAPAGHAAHATPHDVAALPAHHEPAPAPSPDDAPPCAALSACGAAAALEAPRPARVPVALRVAVLATAHELPAGPATAPDVPPPRS